jgi:hypothetical protein
MSPVADLSIEARSGTEVAMSVTPIQSGESSHDVFSLFVRIPPDMAAPHPQLPGWLPDVAS